MKDLLDRLSKAVNEMSAPSTAETPETPAADAPVEMSLEDFVGYAVEQVEKAAADTAEIRLERLAALTAAIEVAKNFEGPTPGKLQVQRFKDPAQIVPSTKGVTPKNAPATTHFTSGPPTAPAGNPSTPSGGQLPPMTAGGSGFSTPAAATFAKAMEDLQKAIEGIAKGDATETPAAPPTAPVEPTMEEAPAPATVTKAADTEPLWPMDMNTDFGRGKVEDDTTPEWGFDPLSPGAQRQAAEKATAEKAEADKAEAAAAPPAE